MRIMQNTVYLNNMYNTLKAEDSNLPKKITKILVVCGFNDYNKEQTNIKWGISQFFEKAKEFFPNAKVILTWNAWSKYISQRSLMLEVIPLYRNANYVNGKFLQNSEYIMHNYTFYNEFDLPSLNNAQFYIAKFINEGIKNGICNVYYKISQTPQNMKFEKITQELNNDKISFTFTNKNFQLSEIAKLIDCGELPALLIYEPILPTFLAVSEFQVGEQYNISAMLLYSSTHLYARPLDTVLITVPHNCSIKVPNLTLQTLDF